MNLLKTVLRYFRPKSDLYLFGSSILWSQGNKPKDKMGLRVARWIEEELGERVVLHVGAHSGAELTGGPVGKVDLVDGEVPVPWPSVEAQIAAAAVPGSSRVRILVEGGINDVGPVRISSPLTSPEYIERATAAACSDRFKQVLKALLARYPGAEIYVLGYYQILAEATGDEELEALLEREGHPPLEREREERWRDRAVANTRLFRELSDRFLSEAVQEVGQLARGSCRFVGSGFVEEDGLFGRTCMLFPPFQKDPMFRKRAAACTRSLVRGQTGLHCYVAAVAHPNREGVGRYVEQIVAAMKEQSERQGEDVPFEARVSGKPVIDGIGLQARLEIQDQRRL